MILPQQRVAFAFHRRRSPPSSSSSSSSSTVARRGCSATRDSSSSSSSYFSSMYSESSIVVRRVVLVLSFVALSGLLLYVVADSFQFFGFPSGSFSSGSFSRIFDGNGPPRPLTEEEKLEKVLKDASMGNNTVILTTLNEAWAAPNSILDLFLNSFRIGNGTEKLLNHLVIVALDRNAFRRCLAVHKHCYALVTEGVDFHKEAFFMTPSYLKMMWRRIDFLRSILEMGYDFVFTDADIMWFRDPFPWFYSDADFQIACDHFLGRPEDMQNRPNGGFNYVRSNNKSIEFYKFWYSSQENYPGYHDQDVLNFIKFDPFISNIGLKIKFLDTANFGGLCEHSKDLNVVCTMHANCCVGLDNKLHDLRVMLKDWRAFMSLPPDLKNASMLTWRVPQKCSLYFLDHHGSSAPEESVQLERGD